MNFSAEDLNLEKLLELAPMIGMLRNNDGTLDIETVQKFYAVLAQKYRPLMDQVPALVGIVAGDIGGIGENLVDSILAISNSPRSVSARTKMLHQRATLRKQAFDSYIAAGFTTDMAKSLLLTDVANTKIARADAVQNAKNVVNERRSTTKNAA